MRNYAIALFLCFMCFKLNAQEYSSTLASINLKTLEGKTINTSEFDNDNAPIVICFSTIACKNCTKELDAIADVYDNWQEETGVKLIAISIDDERNSSKVAPYVNGKDWPFEIYLDSNSELKRAMNVNITPHTFLLNANKEIVWQKSTYIDGDEDVLFEEILKSL